MNKDSQNPYSNVTLLKGKYEILSCLGRGGFGEVYRVRNKETGDLFAAKRVKIFLKEDLDQALKEFLLVSQNLDHPNIVKVFEYEKSDFEFIFIMELGECDLKNEIDKAKLTDFHREEIKNDHFMTSDVFTFERAFPIFKDIISALSYAIKKGIHYGDVKPTNIIKFKNSYKIGDWGTASLKDYGVGNTMTVNSSKSIVGTLLYMAPELQDVFERDANISTRGILSDQQKVKINFEKTDIFSLGLLVLEVYFGFQKHHLKKIKQKISESDYNLSEQLFRLKPKCPAKFCQLVSVMLSYEHEKRPSFGQLEKFFDEWDKFAEEGGPEFPTMIHSCTSTDDTLEGVDIDVYSITQIMNNPNKQFESKLETMRKIKKGSFKNIAAQLIKWNKFFDFEVNEHLIDVLKNQKKCLVVSISGRSGLGKSTSLNLLISILAQYEQVPDEGHEFKYYEVFKVGDGAHGTTNGLDISIVSLDEEYSVLLVDLQGSNDKRSGKQWKFLYFSLFYIIFLISDIHFFLYDGNVEEIEQSELSAIIKEKEKFHSFSNVEENSWTRETELVTIRKNNQKNLKGKRLQNMIEEHVKKATQVYSSRYYKGKTFFCRQNEHFDTIEEEICINEGKICEDCRGDDCFKTMIDLAEFLHKRLHETKKLHQAESYREGEKILSDLHYIFREVQEKRYNICFQAGNLIDEYLSHASWCYELKCEKIEKYDFFEIFKKVFGNDVLPANSPDEEKIKLNDKLARNFGQIYLNAVEFNKFIESNLEEHGNNILQLPEVDFMKNTFIARMEECYKDFIFLIKHYLDFQGFQNPDFTKNVKNRLKDIYQNIKAQKLSEEVEKKLNFCELLFKKNKREGMIYYLLLNEDSIHEIMKDDLVDDKFEYTHAVCGLKFAEFLIGIKKEKIVELHNCLELMVEKSKKDHAELSDKMKKGGFDKSKDIIKILYRMKKTLENFLERSDTKLKILLD